MSRHSNSNRHYYNRVMRDEYRFCFVCRVSLSRARDDGVSRTDNTASYDTRFRLSFILHFGDPARHAETSPSRYWGKQVRSNLACLPSSFSHSHFHNLRHLRGRHGEGGTGEQDFDGAVAQLARLVFICLLVSRFFYISIELPCVSVNQSGFSCRVFPCVSW